MDDRHGLNISALREDAAHYRRLASGPMPWPLVQQLESLAEECDREVSKLTAQRSRA